MSMMAISKSLFLFFLVICLLAFVGFSQGEPELPCVQKLLPCHPYLKGTIPPPAMCCVPLKEIVETDGKCLCTVFSNSVLLKGLNITQDDGLNLAKTCGANADPALCKDAASPGVPTVSSTSNSSTEASPPKNDAASISQVGRYLSMAAFFSSVIVSVF